MDDGITLNYNITSRIWTETFPLTTFHAASKANPHTQTHTGFTPSRQASRKGRSLLSTSILAKQRSTTVLRFFCSSWRVNFLVWNTWVRWQELWAGTSATSVDTRMSSPFFTSLPAPLGLQPTRLVTGRPESLISDEPELFSVELKILLPGSFFTNSKTDVEQTRSSCSQVDDQNSFLRWSEWEQHNLEPNGWLWIVLVNIPAIRLWDVAGLKAASAWGFQKYPSKCPRSWDMANSWRKVSFLRQEWHAVPESTWTYTTSQS